MDVVFSHDGAFLICADLFQITVWEVATGKKIREVSHKVTQYNYSFSDILALSQDGEILAFRQNDGAIGLLESSTARTIRTINTYLGSVRKVAFSLDKQLLAASGSQPHTVEIVAVNTGRVIRTINTHPQEYITAIVFSPDGQILAVKNEDFITLWQVSSGERIHRIEHDYWDYDVNCLAFSSDGQILVSPTREATIKFWDVATGDEICTLPGHSLLPTGPYGSSGWIGVSRYGNILVSGGEDGMIKVWQQK